MCGRIYPCKRQHYKAGLLLKKLHNILSPQKMLMRMFTVINKDLIMGIKEQTHLRGQAEEERHRTDTTVFKD